MLTALSPLDGRYAGKCSELRDYFSEYALIKYRTLVEIKYLLAIADLKIPQVSDLGNHRDELMDIAIHFSEKDSAAIKVIEKTTNHDVKAVEYFIKAKMKSLGLEKYEEWVHFGLTSQDINNTAFPLMINECTDNIIVPALKTLLADIHTLRKKYSGIPMLARTHGQPASPTTLGKEIAVFEERLHIQVNNLNESRITAKFGGATGNFNAHKVTFPNIDWKVFADRFLESMGLKRQQTTTQIAHYDSIAAYCHVMSRINTILIDMARDMWTYISMEYFRQKTVAGEIGSSAMPHKVNPIDFENAEGNLAYANAIFLFLAEKLPVSRLQRDLTDSTVLRNIGVPLGHTLIALKSFRKGLGKIELNKIKLDKDLDDNWAVVAEGIQCILRREGYNQPYEALKALTRGKKSIDQAQIHSFIESLDVSKGIKEELKAITPHNYTGFLE